MTVKRTTRAKTGRGRGRPTNASYTVLGAFLARTGAEIEDIERAQWPNPKYHDNPVGFVRDVLKDSPLPHQEAIMGDVAKWARVAVRSGQKVGKTRLVIWLALWWYCTRPPGSKVIMTAAIKDQIDKVLWSELQSVIGRANKAGLRIGEPGATAQSGMVAEDGRRIYGFTARDREAVAGISGPALLFIVDEASALKQEFAEAIEGNKAGGECRTIFISNPTRLEGPFYDAFHSQSKFWRTHHVDSEKVAQYIATMGLHLPGVASAKTIAEWVEMYGRDDPFFLMRVRGEFVLDLAGRIIPVSHIQRAQEDWAECEERGLLSIGVDPAGAGDSGDEWGFAVVRGRKALNVFTRRGLTKDSAENEVTSILREYRQGDEIPRVMIDAEGDIGSDWTGQMKGRAEFLKVMNPKESFEVYGIRAGNPAAREPRKYNMMRDEMAANLAAWMSTGCIQKNYKLETELKTPGWVTNVKGKLVATPKKALRELLGRSPDSADALTLAVWDPSPWLREHGLMSAAEPPRESTLPDRADRDDVYEAGVGIDPYAY